MARSRSSRSRADRARPAARSYQSSAVRFDIAPETLALVRAASRAAGVTPFVFLLSVYVATLARWSGQDDFVVGTAAANRARPETHDLVGLFVNTLAIRARVDLGQPFAALLEEVKQSALGAFLHQEVPFNRVVDAIKPPRDLTRSIVFQTMFVLHNMPLPHLVIPGLDVEPVETSAGASEYDLAVFVAENGDRASVSAEFNTDVFDTDTIERLMSHWSLLLAGAAADPSMPTGALPLLSADERDVLLEEWASVDLDVMGGLPAGVTRLDQLVSDRGRRAPGAVAVEHRDEILTYRQLDERANQLARRLVGAGVAPGDRVGVAVERSTSMLVSLLGVLKCGAAYVPLDPAFPADRLAFMVADAGLQVVLVSPGALTGSLDLSAVTAIDVVAEWPDISTLDATPLDHGSAEAPGGGVAYVIYTSGSTGIPKGVEIEHHSVVNFVLSMLHEPGLSADDVLLAVTTLSFDISVLELFAPLAAGGRVVIASREDAIDGRRLAALIESCGATVMQATPTTWSMLFEAGWLGAPALKVLCGGEAMPVELGRRLLQRCGSLWNMFGPTETTIWSTVHEVGEASLEHVNVPIGRPIANTVCRVLDANGELVPIGVPGELFIGGAGVARGYLHREELTKERFVPDPFDQEARLYRTGDLARWLPDGSLEYLGRLDLQVKVRGHRIELGEIESGLRAHGQITDAVVVADADTNSGRLLAYVVPADRDTAPTAGDLRSWLQQRLPDYMIPSRFIPIDAFPMTPNRKIDRKALPRPDSLVIAETEYVAPRNDVERVVAGLFAETLGIERAGAVDSLFDLGGHSLHATSVLAKIETIFGVSLELRRFFVDPSVAATAATLTEDPETRPRIERVAQLRVKLDSMSPDEVAAMLAAKRAPRESP